MNIKCEVLPINGNIVVEEITESRKTGSIIVSSRSDRGALSAYRIVALPPDNELTYLCLGDEVLCGEDDLKEYVYSTRKLFLIKGDYISGIREKK